MASCNLKFDLVGRTDSGLTSVWEVKSVHTNILLGQVKWYSKWRRYTFQDNNIYDAVCLNEIASFLDSQTKMQKETK